MSNPGPGPQVLDNRRRVHFELQQYMRAIKFLESLGQASFSSAAAALVDRFVRPGGRCCAWADVVGQCGLELWKPDNSGGFCRECGHHKDRCQPCRNAIAAYMLGKKREKAGLAPAPERKAVARKAAPASKAPKLKRAKLRIEDAIAAEASPHDLGRLANAILSLRDQLTAAEDEFRSKANSLFPGWSFMQSSAAAR